MQKSNPESSDSKIRPRHLTQDAFCFAARDGTTPFSNEGNRGSKKSPVLSPSLGFVGQGMHTESGDRSQLRRSHWQQFPFNLPWNPGVAQRRPRRSSARMNICDSSGHCFLSVPVRRPGWLRPGLKLVLGQRGDQAVRIKNGFVFEHEIDGARQFDGHDGVGLEFVAVHLGLESLG